MTIWLASRFGPDLAILGRNAPAPTNRGWGAFLACIQDGRALGAYENACRRSFI